MRCRHLASAHRGFAGRNAVVVVQAPAALQVGRRHHVDQTVSTPAHRLRDVEDLVRGEVEQLDEQRVLVAEEAGT